jgi:hypothetical protein
MASRASTRTLCTSKEGAREQGISSLAAYRAQARSFAPNFHSLQLAIASQLQQQSILGSTTAYSWSLTRIREGHASGHHASTTSGCETWSNENHNAVHRLPMQCERGCHRQTAGRMKINNFIRVRSRRTPMQIWAKSRKSVPEQGMPVRIIGLALACDNLQYTTVRTLPCPDATCEFVLQHWH